VRVKQSIRAHNVPVVMNKNLVMKIQVVSSLRRYIHEHTSNDIIFKSQRHWNSLYNNLDYAVADVARFLSLQFCLPATVLLLLYY